MNEDHTLSTTKTTLPLYETVSVTKQKWNTTQSYVKVVHKSFWVMRSLNGLQVCKPKSCSIFIFVESVKNDSDVKPKAAGLKILFA